MSTFNEAKMLAGINWSYAEFEEKSKNSFKVMEKVGENFFIENEGYNAMNVETIADLLELYNVVEDGEDVFIGIQLPSQTTEGDIKAAFEKARNILNEYYEVPEEEVTLLACVFTY